MPTPSQHVSAPPVHSGAPMHSHADSAGMRANSAAGPNLRMDDLPPPIRRRNGRAWLLIGAGVAVAALLTVVVLNIDHSDQGDAARTAAGTFDPDSAPPEAGVDKATDIRAMQGDVTFVQTERGWIQATENGRLSQEYRYSRSEPGPSGRLRMTRPEVKIYMKDRRVLTLRGESADVHAPSKALESGTMTGDVEIRLYELDADRQLDDLRDVPLLEVRTNDISFDNFQGEIICPGEVDIQTQTAHLPAVGLRMQINDLEGRPGQLVIHRVNGELRLAEALQERAGADEKQLPSGPDEASPSAERTQQRRGAAADRRQRAAAEPRSESAAQTDRAQRQRERARDRRESRFPQPDPIVKQSGPYFYRLTLNQNVRIRQGDGTVGWTARGDQLHIVFSLDSDDLSGSLSHASVERESVLHGPAEPMSLEMRLALLAIAAVQEASLPVSTSAGGLFKASESDTIITCDGSLTMLPLVNAAEQPESAKDSRFELIGSPVTLHNAEDQTDITCATMRYASLSELMTLIGTPQHRLTIDSPELHAECDDRFWVDRLNNKGAFEGRGWMLAGEGGEQGRGATQPALPLSDRGDVRIAWSDGVELEFEPSTTVAPAAESQPRAGAAHASFGRLRLAMFSGAVDVQSPDFALTADRMGVGFPAGSGGADAPHDGGMASIEYVHAEQNVKAGSMSDGGSITCQDLRVHFTNHKGRTLPLNMLATGGVAAVDQEGQTVWADELDVKFAPVAEGQDQHPESKAGHGPWQDPGAGAATSEQEQKQDRPRRAEVQSLTATGSVQIQMSDGARVFADRLEADGQGNQVVLLGDDIMVVSDRNIIRHGTRLELTERGDRVHWPGPGEFSYYTNPILSSAESRRIARPEVDALANPRQMLALWNESMTYDALSNEGGGSLEIRGTVNAQSTPSPLEVNTMLARELTLLFAKVQTTVGPAPAATMPSHPASAPASKSSIPAGGMFAMEQRGRQLEKLIARGDAKLESRTWLNADRSDRPRVFHLAGDEVTYDDQTLEADVQGKGTLLIRDERPAPPGAATQPQTSDRQADLPFGARGTTLFNWSDGLRMTRKDRESSLYDIVMSGGVEVRHRALDNSVSTMTGNRLEATVDRTQGAAQRDAGFDLGGSMDLKRIHASGSVYVDSPSRDVDCDEFDYDYVTGLARLNAQDGRTVTIVTAGNPHPVQARSFLWNTIDDTVVVTGASGSSGK